MYLPAIDPIVKVCSEAIERGLAGDIKAARRLIDRARVMRAWLMRSVNSHRKESLDVWIQNSGIDSSEIHHYRSQIAQLNANLEVIRAWLSSSVAASSHEDLLSSREGVSLYIDTVVPEIWDFSQDVVVLHGAYRSALFEDLKLRGQRNFVVIIEQEEETADQVIMETPTDNRNQSVNQVVVSFPTGSSPHTESFHKLVGQEIPSIVLIGAELDSAAQTDFECIYKSLAAVLLGKKSTKEWPAIFTEQWLGRLPALTHHQSVCDLAPLFVGRDVLIASPGPSLYESLADLRANRKKFLLIAPIRSLLTLLKSDIVPDFAFHVDATDFSKIIPAHPMIRQVSLICTDYAHASVFDGGFGRVFTVPEPHLLGNAISEAFHDRAPPVLEGGCVATCAVGFAAQFRARSITLVGQDLSLSRGRYVEQTGGTFSGPQQQSGKDDAKDVLTCEGINGERLITKHDYLWFIGEMENAARFFSPHVMFINSTAHGALLRGWLHKTLDQHPLLADGSVKKQTRLLALPHMSAEELEVRGDAISNAIKLERADIEQATHLCAELVAKLRALVASGSNDVTELGPLESSLESLLRKKGSILRFYTSRFSMALAAASKSVQSLHENLNISAEYYHQVEGRAKKLASMLDNALSELESLRTDGKVVDGR